MEQSKNMLSPSEASNSNTTHTQNLLVATDMFVSQLSPLQQRALVIAREHLNTSFDMERSNGFTEWRSSFK